MAKLATFEYAFDVREAGVQKAGLHDRIRWTAGVLKQETVTLTQSAFTALTVPSGAKALVLLCDSLTDLVLKGVTGDTGIKLTPASNPIGLPVVIPLGSSPSIGLLNNKASDQSVELLWL